MAKPGGNEQPAEPAGHYQSHLRQEGGKWQLVAEDRDVKRAQAPGIVPALENAIAILDFINRTPPHVASLAEIAGSLAISKSHCHNILKTLVHFGWLKFDDRAKSYELSSGLIAAASSLHGAPVLGRIRAELARMVTRINLSAVLTQPLPDDTFVVIDKFNVPGAMELSFPIGHHFPPETTAASRAYLAWQSPGRIDAWMRNWQPIRYTSATLMTPDDVRREIEATRRRGYARSVGEFTEGLMAFGMPIFDRMGEVIYVFTCSGLLNAIAPREEAIAREVIRSAIEIHRAILGRPPADFPASPD